MFTVCLWFRVLGFYLLLITGNCVRDGRDWARCGSALCLACSLPWMTLPLAPSLTGRFLGRTWWVWAVCYQAAQRHLWKEPCTQSLSLPLGSSLGSLQCWEVQCASCSQKGGNLSSGGRKRWCLIAL